MALLDVVVQTNHGWLGNRNAPTPPEIRFQLTPDLYLEKLGPDAAKVVLDLGEPSGYGVVRPARQYGYFYAFVREVPEPASVYDWDTDNRIQTAVALSRLVRPTSISYRYAARLQLKGDGTVSHAFPAWLRGVDPDSWLAPEQSYRDWLIAEEFESLRTLLLNFSKATLPVRVSRALWYHEHAARTYYGELRWIAVCTALESLIHTHSRHSTRQFTTRVPQMASMVGVRFDEQEAKMAYDMRSRLAHGGATGKLAPVEEQLYVKLEAVLRSTVRRAMSDPAFANIFTDEDQIRAHWPVKLRGKSV